MQRNGIGGWASWRVVACVAMLALVGGCGGAEAGAPDGEAASRAGSVQAVDDAGRAVRLPRPATRIISLVPAATETLVELGLKDRLVARTDYDDPELAYLPTVGGGLTPSLELMVSLEPDLVIAWNEAGGSRFTARLEALGIPVFAVATSDTAGVFANIDRLGRLTGVPERADSLAAAMRADLATIAESVEGRERPTVAYVIGFDPPIIAGPSVFIGEMVEVAGGRNVFADVGAPSPQISLEEIVRRQPEVVLLPASGPGATALEQLRVSPGWRQLFESGRTRFHVLPPDILHRPGPSIVEAARVLRSVLHPDAEGGP